MADDLGMSSGALSECLAPPKQFSKWVGPIDDYFRKKGWPEPDPARWSYAITPPDSELVDPSDPKAATIRRNVRAARERAGFDVEGAADTAGVTAEQWLRWERGEQKPSITELELIATTLGHDVGDLFTEGELPPTKLGPHEKLWARRRVVVAEDLRVRLREAEEAARKAVLESFSPGFLEAKKKQQTRAKERKR